jgi:hypothetical protein
MPTGNRDKKRKPIIRPNMGWNAMYTKHKREREKKRRKKKFCWNGAIPIDIAQGGSILLYAG